MVIDVKNEITPWRGYLNSPVFTSYELCAISSRGYFNRKLMGKLKDSREDGAISIGPFESTVELFK